MIKYEIGNDELKGSLERILERKADVPDDKSVALVEMKIGGGGRRLVVGGDAKLEGAYYAGFLEEILSRASKGEIIVLVGDERKVDMAGSPEWQGVMGYPNVSYCETRNLVKQLGGCIDEVVNQTRPKNEIAIELAGVVTPQSTIGGLRHAIYGEKASGGVSDEWRRQAKVIFGGLSDDELIEKVNNADRDEVRSLFEGRKLDAAFFDIEGTLIQQGKVNQDLVAELNAVSQELPVIVWTDGDLKNAKALREAGVFCPVRPKSIFAGASVAKAWDDRQEDDLKQEFRISVDEFHHVSNIPEEDLREGAPDSPEHE